MAANPNSILPESLFTIKVTSVYRKQVCEERGREEREGRGGEERGEERRGARGASWRQLPTQFHLRVCVQSKQHQYIENQHVRREEEREERRGRRGTRRGASTPNSTLPDSLVIIRATSVHKKPVC